MEWITRAAKWVLSFLMLIGRLELFSVLLLFYPGLLEKLMDKGDGKHPQTIKCHFVYSITYRQPCFVPVANGFEKNDYRRLGTERGDADLAAFRLLCFVYAWSAFGSKVYGREPSFFVSSDHFASRVLIIRKWPDQSPFFILSALLGRGCTVALKGMHRCFERNAPLLSFQCRL